MQPSVFCRLLRGGVQRCREMVPELALVNLAHERYFELALHLMWRALVAFIARPDVG